jgi:hypothetical protein
MCLIQAREVVVHLVRECDVEGEYRDRQQGAETAKRDPANSAARPVGSGPPGFHHGRDANNGGRDADHRAEDQQVNEAVQVSSECEQRDQAEAA